MAAKWPFSESISSDSDQLLEEQTRTTPTASHAIGEVAMVNSFKDFFSVLEPLLRRVQDHQHRKRPSSNCRRKDKIRQPYCSCQSLSANQNIDGGFGRRLSSGVHDDWSQEEFESNIVKERTGKRLLLTGDVNVTIKNGVARVEDIEFTDNSNWIRSRKFRIGAKVAQWTYHGVRIREAITEAFVVKDHRGELYKKHHPPMLEDEVWRLGKIGRGGNFCGKLAASGIKTVQDFLKVSIVEPQKLRRILGTGMSEKMWDTMKHARTCSMGSKLYIFRGQNCIIILNPICQVVRATINGQTFLTRDLPNLNGTYIENLVREAYSNWHSLEVVEGVSNALLTQGDLVNQYRNHNLSMMKPFQQNGSASYKSQDVGFLASSSNTQFESNDSQIQSAYVSAPGIGYSISESSSNVVEEVNSVYILHTKSSLISLHDLLQKFIMSKSILPAHILHCVPTILCFLIAVPASHGDVDERFAVCSRQVDCGTLSLDIGYPFWGDGLRPQYCGRQEFYLDCQNNPNQNPTQSPTIFMGSEAFRVLDIDDGHQTMIITPARLDLLSSYCPSVQWPQAIINHTLFSLQCDITRTMNPVRHVPLLKGYADLMRLQTNLCVFAVINPTCLPPQLVCLLPPHAHPPKYYGGRQSSETQTEACHRTSHVNVVTLLGFCLEGNNRALIYEFMPNGSLEKFVYNGDTSKPCQYLRWEKMYEIVIGIAKGLEYLHRGCSTRILHFDIKPHNILLDQDFCPKISDFGLAKLCTTKKGIVSSLLGARGTIGYIALEVFSRNFGEVSHKSDVYSFGMMIMELVGCKNNLDSGVDNSSEARPYDRPPMNEVIEMLQGSTEALQIPPTPFLSSPPRASIDSSTLRYGIMIDAS
ncbi:hypothetical protein KPL71_007455 [Citrus sinensis]|uniref:Uncharacterized protein n=1 Tax=Citrus sinensis TaxID=2711 RepID=A0ACB8LYW6_CITSI|nr:hypothetical protein KPL71_007455 [Citrus sinensis]